VDLHGLETEILEYPIGIKMAACHKKMAVTYPNIKHLVVVPERLKHWNCTIFS
jgi:hypothetical protein